MVEIAPGRFAARQQVVYTGVYLNEIARLDIAQSAFTADFYLWMRFAAGFGPGVADPTEIELANLVRGAFDPTRPAAQGELDHGTTWRLWQVRGDFKNDFDLRRFPADRQTLAIRFFNAHAASDRLVYVLDQRSFDPNAGLTVRKATAEPKGPGSAAAADSAPPASADQHDDPFGGTVAQAAFRNPHPRGGAPGQRAAR